MNRIMVAAVAGIGLVGTAASVAGAATVSGPDRQPGLILKVNSTGWGARVSQDRYPYAYGFADDGYATTGAPVDGYVYEQQPISRQGYRRAVPVAPFGYEPDDD